MDRYLISIGAGKNQIPFIEQAVRRGYKVIAFDLDYNAPGKKYCSFFKNISAWDYEEAISWTSNLGVNIIGVGCFSCGKALITQQKILKFFNLPGQIVDENLKFIGNKKELRLKLVKSGLNTLEEYSYNNSNFSIEKLTKETYILKYKDGISSKDIRVINKELLLSLINNNSLNDNILIQPLLIGEEYRITSIIQKGEIKFIATMKRENLKDTLFNGRMQAIKDESGKFENLLKNIIDKFKMHEGFLKIDLIESEDKLEILEIDFGISGDYFEKMISPIIYDYDYINNYINLILGLKVERNNLSNIKYNYFFDYIYNTQKNVYKLKKEEINKILKKSLKDYDILYLKENNEIIQYPKSNIDAMAVLIHNKKEFSNHLINELISK